MMICKMAEDNNLMHIGSNYMVRELQVIAVFLGCRTKTKIKKIEDSSQDLYSLLLLKDSTGCEYLGHEMKLLSK